MIIVALLATANAVQTLRKPSAPPRPPTWPPPAADPFDMFAAPSSAPATTSNDDILKMF